MMDSRLYKRYNGSNIDCRQFLEDYFSDTVFEEDFLKFSIERLTDTFKEGCNKGDTLIDISICPFIHHLPVVFEFFKQIILLKDNDQCIVELKSLLEAQTGSFDWDHVLKFCRNLQGSSDQVEEKVRTAFENVVKYDLEKKNITDPMVLPPADCVISNGLLDVISKDQVDYRRNVRKFSGLLKPGGYLILIGNLNMTYLTVGEDKFCSFTQDEDFVREALVAEGFAVNYSKVHHRTAESDLTDYDSILFITAQKNK